MRHYSSTLETVDVCQTCKKNLKETEVYFYKNTCTECIFREIQERIKELKK